MILLGITGSVAAITAPKLIKALKEYDNNVEVIVTDKVYAFLDIREVGRLCNRVWTENDEWQWKTEGNYITKMWSKNDPVLHIELRKRADMLVVAPATANTIAKFNNGICDNLLTSVFAAWDRSKPVYIAPAMNTYMWENKITNRNVSSLRLDGYRIIEPQCKKLACGDYGYGAMADISEIIRAINPTNYGLDKPWFPLGGCNGIPVNPHPGAFGFARKDSRHTGVDLYVDDNSPVFAMEPGVVVSVEHFTGIWDNSPWWNDTDCILIEGKSGVICYGEVTTNMKVGDTVHIGQHIANVKRVIKEGRERPEITGWKPNMLHLELYRHGRTCASAGFDSELLLDPTEMLLNSYGAPREKFIYADYKPR